MKVPVTVKMRLGWDADAPHRPVLRPGVRAGRGRRVTIHGRTREQGFSRRVGPRRHPAVVEAVERIPVIGNGDVRTIPDAERMIRGDRLPGIAIGRGALAEPLVLPASSTPLATGHPGPRATYDERLDFMRYTSAG